MSSNETPEAGNHGASPCLRIESARRLPVKTIAAKLVQPSGTFVLRWRASATVAALEVAVAFVLKGDRAWLRLSPDTTTSVRLEAVRQPRGGRRWIFVEADGTRCTVLLRPEGADRFRSRKAWGGMSYPSQRRSPRRRAADRAVAIRAELRGSRDLATPFPPRPAGMRSNTYARLRAEAEAATAVALTGRPLVLPNHQEHRP